MTLTFTILLGILVVILGYTTFNLLSKNEKASKNEHVRSHQFDPTESTQWLF